MRKTGADIDEVSKAVGLDSRIGPKFLRASIGFGGSCFKKDILNLVYIANFYGLKEVADYWESVVKINNYQTDRFFKNIINSFDLNVASKVITILGWSFKKDTNDSRESASIYLTEKLISKGFTIKVYDPMVNGNRIKEDIERLLIDKGKLEEQTADVLTRLKICDEL